MKSAPSLFLLAAAALFSSPPAFATKLPPGLAESIYVTGLTRPTQMAWAPDGRLFVCEQDGKIRIVKGGVLLADPFMTLAVDSVGERGLISVAFDPDFAINNYIYVFYTAPVSPVKNRVSRFTANGDYVMLGTELILLETDGSRAAYHNSGALHFGPDGKLYISVGDNTRLNVSQSRASLLGKILRMNKDGSVPEDNPFFSDPVVTGEFKLIWAFGIRNAYSFAIDKNTGRLYLNDVGADAWEEVNQGAPGANFGWPTEEGPPSGAPIPQFTYPVFSYKHDDLPNPTPVVGCAVVGADFYNSSMLSLPAKYVGRYFFGDVCGRWIRVLNPVDNTTEEFATETTDPSDLDFGPDGALYYTAREGEGSGAGRVYRIAAAGNSPAITSDPESVTVTLGKPVSFRVTASGSEPLRYQWQKNAVNIPGATSATYNIASAALTDNGAAFRAVVTNAHGSATSRSAILTVTANTAPSATIVLPAAGTLYTAGSNLSYSGTATDAEDGVLPASAFTWSILFHHDTHTHPFMPATPGSRTGTVFIPNDDHPEDTVWFRIHLTVKDSGGLTHSIFRDIFPRKNRIRINTVPPGLRVNVDGPPVVAPYETGSVVGVIRTLGVAESQVKDGVEYKFVSWSDGGAATHTITTSVADQAFTATFLAVPATTIQYSFQEVDLGFSAYAMNNRGWIVGAEEEFPRRYRPGIGTEQISKNNGILSDINDAGTSVGALSTGGTTQAIIRPAGQAWKSIGSLGGGFAMAHAINEAGQVVGMAYIRGNHPRPFIYTEAEGMKMIVDRQGEAIGINEAGQITGNYNSPSGTTGFLWDPVRGMIDIESQPAVIGNFSSRGISDNGTVVGEYRNGFATFSLAGGFRNIGDLRGVRATPRAINNRGWSVGLDYISGGPSVAVLYVYGQGLRDLNTLTPGLPVQLIEALDINDRDQILARGGSPARYFLLTRVR